MEKHTKTYAGSNAGHDNCHEAAKKKVSSIEEEKKKVQATIKNLEGLKNDAAAYVKELDGSLTKLEGELDQLSAQIGTKEQ